MAIPSLSGHIPLNERSINAYITKTSAGVYVLGPAASGGGVTVKYVGRSDIDLAARLKQHIGKETHFVYAYMSSPMMAFQAECQLYHRFNPAGNSVHPGRPQNTNWKCPGCNVF